MVGLAFSPRRNHRGQQPAPRGFKIRQRRRRQQRQLIPQIAQSRWYVAVTPLDAAPASVTSAMIASKNTLTSRPSLLGERASEFEINVTPAKLTQPPVHRRLRRQAGLNHVDAGE